MQTYIKENASKFSEYSNKHIDPGTGGYLNSAFDSRELIAGIASEKRLKSNVVVFVVDLAGVGAANEFTGRKNVDLTFKELNKFVQEIFGDTAVLVRKGGDELVIAIDLDSLGPINPMSNLKAKSKKLGEALIEHLSEKTASEDLRRAKQATVYKSILKEGFSSYKENFSKSKESDYISYLSEQQIISTRTSVGLEVCIPDTLFKIYLSQPYLLENGLNYEDYQLAVKLSLNDLSQVKLGALTPDSLQKLPEIPFQDLAQESFSSKRPIDEINAVFKPYLDINMVNLTGGIPLFRETAIENLPCGLFIELDKNYQVKLYDIANFGQINNNYDSEVADKAMSLLLRNIYTEDKDCLLIRSAGGEVLEIKPINDDAKEIDKKTSDYVAEAAVIGVQSSINYLLASDSKKAFFTQCSLDNSRLLAIANKHSDYEPRAVKSTGEISLLNGEFFISGDSYSTLGFLIETIKREMYPSRARIAK
jgi:GGDEF domain-containing protein